MKKLFLTLSIICIGLSNASISKAEHHGTTSDMYIGISSVNFDIGYKTVEGVDLALFYHEDYYASEIYLGKEYGNNFVEFGYFATSTGTKSLTGTVAGITFSGTTAMEFYGIRSTVGRNFVHNNMLESKLKISYYGINFDESAALAVTTGSATFIGASSYSGTDDLITVGYGLNYNINDQFSLEFDYEQSLSEPKNIDEIKILGLNLTYKF